MNTAAAMLIFFVFFTQQYCSSEQKHIFANLLLVALADIENGRGL